MLTQDQNSLANVSPFMDLEDPRVKASLLGLPSAIPQVKPPAVVASPEAPKTGIQAGAPTVAAPTPAAPVTGAGKIATGLEHEIAVDKFKQAHPWGSKPSAEIDPTTGQPFAGNHDTGLGRFLHGVGKVANVAGSIVAPAVTAAIPGSELGRKAEISQDLKKVQPFEAEAEKEAHGVVQPKFAFHYQDASGKEIGVRPDGSTEVLPEGAVTPQRERQNNVDKYLKNPTDSQARANVESDPSTWQKSIPFNGRVENGKLIADPAAPQILVDRNTITGTVTPVGDVKQGASATKPVLKMVPQAGGMEQLMALDPMHPDDMTKAKKIGAPEPIGTSQIMFNDKGEATGTFNTKTNAVHKYNEGEKTANAEAGATPQEQRVQQQKKNQFNTQYEKPATDIEQNYKKFQEALKEYQHDPKTGAASMVALAQHLGSTFGSVKGAQMGENMIAEHKDAIGIMDRLQRYFDQAATGQQLSADQWTDFNSLLTKTREIQWDTTAREAFRQGLPVNMVPADVKVVVQHGGKAYPIPGNKLAEAIKDGATIE
jgi:hypothetical protein